MLESASTGILVATLAASALVIGVFGSLLSRQADLLADRTGMGEAITGAVLLGGTTSISGSVLSVTTAYQGFPQLAASNAIGGIAVQTAFLAVADITYRRANLEHAAASIGNMVQAALLATLLAIPLLAMTSPEVTWWGIHPASLAIFGMYLFGLRIVKDARHTRLWRATATAETRADAGQDLSSASTWSMWTQFSLFALITAAAGYVVAGAGIGLVEQAGIEEAVVGAYVTATITSLPELVTTLAAVRRGALTLAVAGIIGGNAFDVLFLAFSDVAYAGSIYHALAEAQVFLISLALAMTGILLLGLLRRQPRGIGFEGYLVLALYAGGAAVQAF